MENYYSIVFHRTICVIRNIRVEHIPTGLRQLVEVKGGEAVKDKQLNLAAL
jgi:hypothetical protein